MLVHFNLDNWISVSEVLSLLIHSPQYCTQRIVKR